MLCSRPMFVVYILFSCSAVVFGQAPPGPHGMYQPGSGAPSFSHGSPGPLPLIVLATQKSVQAELKLDQTQKQRIQALDSKLRGSMLKHMPPPPEFLGNGAKPEPPGMGMEKELTEILSEKQLARLKQIALQFEGPRALLTPERAKALELTEEQLERLRRLPPKDEKSVKAILNAEQQAKWQEMIGRPFRGKIAFPRMPMSPN